jgi:3-hydroxybutyryl-CoA dehydrogenase
MQEMAQMVLGVLGAGQMGSGIAQVAACQGVDVVLADITLERAAKGKDTIAQALERLVGKGQLSPEARAQALERITPIDTFSAFAPCQIVIEAASENAELKARLFQDLCPHLSQDALLASNTSSISITRLASSTDRPDRFIGLHFFNPVPVMKLVEIISGLGTSAQTQSRIHAFAQMLGKTPISAQDSPSFIVNRVLCPMINEAIFALGDGVGSVIDIDTGLKLGANHPMGPLQLADFIGLDTLLAVMQVMAQGFGDPKYRPAPLLVKYVEAGWLGKKTGRGFYDYSQNPPTPTR